MELKQRKHFSDCSAIVRYVCCAAFERRVITHYLLFLHEMQLWAHFGTAAAAAPAAAAAIIA